MVTGNSDAAVPGYDLPYRQIFPYEFIPDTVEDGQTFICFDVDLLKVENKTFYYPVIYVWVLTHKSRMRLDGGGLLLDELATEITQMLNGDRYFGLGELELGNSLRFTPATDFKGRSLAFYATDFNRQHGSINSPSNRRIGR